MIPTLIGISGGTASGKSTFAALLHQALSSPGANLISLDSYYRPLDHLSLEERAVVNFDSPDALELDLLAEHLRELCAGKSAQIPQYDFATHTRTGKTEVLSPKPFLVVDGLHTFHHEGIREQLHHRVYVHADDNLRLERRIERDIRERGRTRESVLRQWEETVQPMFLQYILPGRMYAQVTVENNGETSLLAKRVEEFVRELFSNREA